MPIGIIIIFATLSPQVELPEVSLDTFLAMLEYLYTDHSPIEETDSIGIMILANQYVLPRLMSLCQLYITKQVDKACAKSIADAEINIIGKYIMHVLYFLLSYGENNFCC